MMRNSIYTRIYRWHTVYTGGAITVCGFAQPVVQKVCLALHRVVQSLIRPLHTKKENLLKKLLKKGDPTQALSLKRKMGEPYPPPLLENRFAEANRVDFIP